MASQDRWIVRRGVLWSAEVGKQRISPVVTASIPVEFGQVTAGSAAQLIAAARQIDPISPDALIRRFETGRECFAGWVNGTIAAYGWLTRGPEWVGEFERELRVQPGEAYIWDCATLPDNRRKRLFGALLCHVAGGLRREGLRRLWIIGVSVPRPLLRGVAAAGFEPVMELTYGRLLDRRCLLAAALPGSSPTQLTAARRLLTAEGEHPFGPLILGNSARPRPPETHFDR